MPVLGARYSEFSVRASRHGHRAGQTLSIPGSDRPKSNTNLDRGSKLETFDGESSKFDRTRGARIGTDGSRIRISRSMTTVQILTNPIPFESCGSGLRFRRLTRGPEPEIRQTAKGSKLDRTLGETDGSTDTDLPLDDYRTDRQESGTVRKPRVRASVRTPDRGPEPEVRPTATV